AFFGLLLLDLLSHRASTLGEMRIPRAFIVVPGHGQSPRVPGARACGVQSRVVASPQLTARSSSMQIRLEPQGKQLTISGRRRVGDVIRSLGIVAGTVIVIRGDDLLTDDDAVEDADTIELRAV